MSDTQTARIVAVSDLHGTEFRYEATYFDTSDGSARIYLDADLIGVHAAGTWRYVFFTPEQGDE